MAPLTAPSDTRRAPLHLGVNCVRLTRPFTGVGRYMECVLDEWSRGPVPFDRITLYTHTPLRQESLCFPLDRYQVRVIGRRLPDPLWERAALSRAADEIDVLFCPAYTAPLGYRGRCLVTNHGPTENRFGSYQWWRSQAYEILYRYSAHRAHTVCAVSRAVKRRLVDVYKVPSAKIHVTHLAASRAFRPIRDDAVLDDVTRRLLGTRRPFVLFVGKLARRHSIPNLLEAFAQLKQGTDHPHALMLVGPDYLHLDIPARAGKLGVADSVVHVPYLEHRELPAVYSAAELFIFPASEAEGFGIPVIEAMACGTPVVTVNRGSLREFAPGAAHLTESSDVSELRNALEVTLADPDLRKTLADRGLERSRELTWKVTADRTMELLGQVVE